jgi:hypothetical protein
MANADQFREAKKVPFQPFRFRLVDGTVYSVEHPDWISVPPIQRAREIFYFAVHDDKTQYDTHRIDLGLVTEVILPPNGQTAMSAPTSGDNGPNQ